MANSSKTSDPKSVANRLLAVTIATGGTAERPAYHVQSIALRRAGHWPTILHGLDGHEFSTSVGATNASTCSTHQTADGGWEIHLAGACAAWTATAVITVPPDSAVVRRRQTYRFLQSGTAAIHPGFRLKADAGISYTCPLHAHEQPLAGLKPIRSAVDWALPFPHGP